TFQVDDRLLIKKGYSRIADIFVKEESFQILDKTVRRLLGNIPADQRRGVAFSDILGKIGLLLQDKDSNLYKAARNKIKVFSPGLLDSILGLSLWSFSQTELLQLNPMADVTNMIEMTITSKKLGVLILGEGLPKHHTLLASVLRQGFDAAVQITADRPEAGGLRGAPLAEPISGRKMRKGGRFADVYGDENVQFSL